MRQTFSSFSGILHKMKVRHTQPVSYALTLDDTTLSLQDFLGWNVSIEFSGEIVCRGCRKTIRKSYNQGYCYPCSQSLACCDICIVKPELCHYRFGTCREPHWGEQHCMQPHIIYLANTAKLKVGITRQSNIPARWIDQGASQAVALMLVSDRYTSGLVEKTLAQYLSDRTDWRAMLRGPAEKVDLVREAKHILLQYDREIHAAAGSEAIQTLVDDRCLAFDYPVLHYPRKMTSVNLEKTPQYNGKLCGVKGQYLLFENAVLNVRRHAGFRVVVKFQEMPRNRLGSSGSGQLSLW